ncbi:uncharacterized protein MEPE_01731 [Melanopsichium pennsylvanicum]|uniref:Dolichol phosphate-mannose biosynthesis regulatory protein n=1 Tax=Melanopsichium pennsylvanicum TaxID=63383 RepID=A0AAJ5C3V7_9BASI|nr:uncharacterized protein MEPE_01731 [Melanopsichium pennsylvanicum]
MSRSINQTRMQAMPNRLVGLLILLISLTLFGSYTLWSIVLPFLPNDSPIHLWIPDRRWTIAIPSFVLVLGLGTIGIYIGMLLRKDALDDLSQQNVFSHNKNQ